MANDLTVILENRPGTLADLGEALGTAGINIDAMCGFPCEGQGVIHVLVEDVDRARQALDRAGIEIKEVHEVLVVDVEDRPGVLGNVARRIANAGVSINLIYLATNTRLVIGADDLQKARTVV